MLKHHFSLLKIIFSITGRELVTVQGKALTRPTFTLISWFRVQILLTPFGCMALVDNTIL